MAEIIEFETTRLRLRQWRAADREPFADLNADPRVMEFFPTTLDRAASNNLADRCEALIAEKGWGPWVVETKANNQFIGFVGLNIPNRDLPFSPCIEILWRLAFRHWGLGFASEAAKGVLQVGFERLHLSEIVSFTPVHNLRSRAVMERIGMQDAKEVFEHPRVPADSSLCVHCLYRLSQERWRHLPQSLPVNLSRANFAPTAG
jgi:RimJ/RimL family protein N-acetyltransferase